jgi:hypothetical protein
MPLLLSIVSRPGDTQLYMHDADTGARVAKNPLSLPSEDCTVVWMKSLGGRVIVLSYLYGTPSTYYLSLLSEDRTSLSTKFTVTTSIETVELIFTDKYVLLAGNNILTSSDLEAWEVKYIPERSSSFLTFGEGSYYLFGQPKVDEPSHLRYRSVSSDLVTWSTSQNQNPVIARFGGEILVHNSSGVVVEDPNTLAFEAYNLPQLSAEVDGILYIGGFAGDLS